ncbi:MAG TPA: sigma-70 family RNA polymerase sigma factor [Polyangiales bacterium]|nr:sigma-70 family RNA polymerase sigma factor [Polyangiales bacterium]
MTDDAREFEALYTAQVGFVWRCLRRLGVRESDLMELTQKVFLTSFVKLPGFEGRSAITSWLFGICERVASDYRRAAPIRREDAELHRLGQEEDLVHASDATRRAQIAEAVLAKLPEDQRLVFVLFEIEELSGDQIAEMLALPLGTVRSRLRLARDAFQREVKRLTLARAREAG